MIFDRSQGLGGRITIKSIHGAVQCQRGRGLGDQCFQAHRCLQRGKLRPRQARWSGPSHPVSRQETNSSSHLPQLSFHAHHTVLESESTLNHLFFFLKSVKHSINIKALSNNFPTHRAPLRKKPASDFFGRTAHRAVFNLLASEILTGPIMVSVFLQ